MGPDHPSGIVTHTSPTSHASLPVEVESCELVVLSVVSGVVSVADVAEVDSSVDIVVGEVPSEVVDPLEVAVDMSPSLSTEPLVLDVPPCASVSGLSAPAGE